MTNLQSEQVKRKVKHNAVFEINFYFNHINKTIKKQN